MSLRCLHVLCLTLALAAASPTPGRVPKVYNALITSSQNLEPSKAYPVYQPVLHDPFAFPYQPVFYSAPDYTNIFQSPRGLVVPQQPQPQPQPQSQSQPQDPGAESENFPRAQAPPASPPASETRPEGPKEEGPSQDSQNPPLPPSTESPIPLNQFGLPSQVVPLGRLDPAYNGFHQISPLGYSYPGFRFYDPFDQFSLNPYANLPPLYRPLTNSLGPNLQGREVGPTPATAAPAAQDQPSSPPPEPDNLNVLNYASKDPAIPNVPPPPLPKGGLKTDSD